MVRLLQHIFSTSQAFADWVRTSGAGVTPGQLPYVVSFSPMGDGTAFRVLYLDEVTRPGDIHAFAGRGLGGIGVAAGGSTASRYVTTTMRYFSVGASEDVTVTGEVFDTVVGASYSGQLAHGMVVPGSVVVHAPGMEDSTDLPAGTPTPHATGELTGDDLVSGEIIYLTRSLELEFDGTPDAGDITVDYVYNPFPASIRVPAAVRLRRIELEYLSGTGTPSFSWVVCEDIDGTRQVPTASGTTGSMTAGDVYSAALDVDSINQDPRVSAQGVRWVGLQADTGTDHIVRIKLLFRGD